MACAEKQPDWKLPQVMLQDEITTTELLSQHIEGTMHISINAGSVLLEQKTMANNFMFWKMFDLLKMLVMKMADVVI